MVTLAAKPLACCELLLRRCGGRLRDRTFDMASSSATFRLSRALGYHISACRGAWWVEAGPAFPPHHEPAPCGPCLTVDLLMVSKPANGSYLVWVSAIAPEANRMIGPLVFYQRPTSTLEQYGGHLGGLVGTPFFFSFFFSEGEKGINFF